MVRPAAAIFPWLLWTSVRGSSVITSLVSFKTFLCFNVYKLVLASAGDYILYRLTTHEYSLKACEIEQGRGRNQ